MKGKYWFTILLLVLLLCALKPERGILAQENEPELMGVEQGRSTTITPVMGYQGRLVEGGEPVTGTRSMTFRLFNAETEGTKFWEETKDVNVANGLFQTALGDTNSFTEGDIDSFAYQVWLEVEVSGTTLPRQLLMGAPYAFSLAPGAMVLGTEGQDVVLEVNTYTGGWAVLGWAQNGVGVGGYSGFGNGVVAKSGGAGKNNAALVTESTATTGGIALYATSNSPGTTAVVHNADDGSLLAGYQGGDFDNPKFRVDNDGSFEQDLAADGLVKAAVSLNCKADPTIDRSFQGVPGASHIATRPDPSGDGCYVDFGFDVSDRFWSATATQSRGYFAGCYPNSIVTTELFCYVYDHAGNPKDGHIMILIY